MPTAVRVLSPDGEDVPAQISGGKVIFLANVPSVGYAVYDVQPLDSSSSSRSSLQVSKDGLENSYYRVGLNETGTLRASSTRRSAESCSPLQFASPSPTTIRSNGPRGIWIGSRSRPRRRRSSPGRHRFASSKMAPPALPSKSPAKPPAPISSRPSVSPQATPASASSSATSSTGTRRVEPQGHFSSHRLQPDGHLQLGHRHHRAAQRRAKKFEVASHQWIDLTDRAASSAPRFSPIARTVPTSPTTRPSA